MQLISKFNEGFYCVLLMFLVNILGLFLWCYVYVDADC